MSDGTFPTQEAMVRLFADGYLFEDHLPYVIKQEEDREAFLEEIDKLLQQRDSASNGEFRRRKKSARSVQPNPEG